MLVEIVLVPLLNITSMENTFNLTDKIILVTGASGGLGSAISLLLSKCGATPILHYNSGLSKIEELTRKIKSLGGSCYSIQANIKDENDVKKLVSTVVEKYKRIDGLVNNAGILLRSFIATQSVDKLQDILDTNLLGNYIVTKHVAAQMIRQKAGCIVNMSSAAGMGGLIGQSAYSMTKGGINSFNIVCAKELASFNIRVNAVSPGFISSGMLQNVMPQDEKYKDIIPLKRFGTSEEVASTVIFLLSDASSYITGQNIVIDGGLLIS